MIVYARLDKILKFHVKNKIIYYEKRIKSNIYACSIDWGDLYINMVKYQYKFTYIAKITLFLWIRVRFFILKILEVF